MNAIDRDDTEKKIAEIREALEKATPGPWTKFENRIYGKAQPAVEPIICEFYEEETERDRNNAHLIANAPEWLRFLLSELDRRDEENRKLRKERDDAREQAQKYYRKFEDEVAEIFQLQEERDKLIEVLRFYERLARGREINDGGRRARTILAEIGVTVE